MNRNLYRIPIFFLLLLLSACEKDPFVPAFPIAEIEGYKPVYVSADQTAIKFTDPQPLINPGKIYTINHYLLINEKSQGIHVFDNTNPSQPIALGFLYIPGNSEMAIRNNVLYADHLTDLVALNIENWFAIKELSRTKQEHWKQNVPPAEGKYFECADPEKGIVIGWKLTTLKYPKCYR